MLGLLKGLAVATICLACSCAGIREGRPLSSSRLDSMPTIVGDSHGQEASGLVWIPVPVLVVPRIEGRAGNWKRNLGWPERRVEVDACWIAGDALELRVVDSDGYSGAPLFFHLTQEANGRLALGAAGLTETCIL